MGDKIVIRQALHSGGCGKVIPDVITRDTPSKLINNDVCNVVTPSSQKVLQDVEVPDNSHDLENTFMNTTDEYIINIQYLSCNNAKILIDQQSDETLNNVIMIWCHLRSYMTMVYMLLSKEWFSYEKTSPTGSQTR